MKIRVDSDEYKCWHEVGHATACLHLGGDVEFIELLVGDARGHARTRCVVATPRMEKIVACGGFAAEVYLLRQGYAEKGIGDERNINLIVFQNAIQDLEDFLGRTLGTDDAFTEAEQRAFMHNAIGVDGNGGLIPLFHDKYSGMQRVVRELHSAKRVEGKRVRDLFRMKII